MRAGLDVDLSGVHLAVIQGGATITTTASSLDFNGNVVLYATHLSGDLLGIPTTLTPGNALSTILQILGQLGLTHSLTQAIPPHDDQRDHAAALHVRGRHYGQRAPYFLISAANPVIY